MKTESKSFCDVRSLCRADGSSAARDKRGAESDYCGGGRAAAGVLLIASTENIECHDYKKVENELFLEELFEDCKTQLGIDHNITIDIFFVLFDSYISMCGSAARPLTRLKISLLLHVSPRQDRFAACSCCACNRAPRCCRRW